MDALRTPGADTVTIHSLELGTDYDRSLIANCSGCSWETVVCWDPIDMYREFNRHLADLYHPEAT